MSKLWRMLLISVYSALLIQYLKVFLRKENSEIIQLEYVFKTPENRAFQIKKLKRLGNKATPKPYNRPIRLPTDYRYILRWSTSIVHMSDYKEGQYSFLENNCTFSNCYYTFNHNLLPDLKHYDAILFDVEYDWEAHPLFRAPHQKYVFVASLSAQTLPICHPMSDSYYNWTWTYKLDSDIRWSYITVFDKEGNEVGPKKDMTWIHPMEPINEDVIKILNTKNKAVAWFASYCVSKSKREDVARNISRELKPFGLTLDIYGRCGMYSCSRDNMRECLEGLQQTYFFYLAFENSLSEDYVSEKLLYALQQYTVPIVFGGANYSRFLPPGSYINAGELNATSVAHLINEAVSHPDVYEEYFRWHNHYVFEEHPKVLDECMLCDMLNNKPDYSTIKDFRKWWNPDYKTLCKHNAYVKV